MSTQRPFYGAFAWAYDALIGTPVPQQCAFIGQQLRRLDVRRSADASHAPHVLDAGCGTGGHAIELARLGYRVTGIDLSPDLLAEARRKAAGVPHVTFVQGNLLELPGLLAADGAAPPGFDAILCRGVLNDLLDDGGRAHAFAAFARSLRPGGALVLDVREWESTARRKAREPVDERLVETPGGRLRFRAVTRLQPSTRRLLVSEEHHLAPRAADESALGPLGPAADADRVAAFEFTMRCWTMGELRERLAAAGFGAPDLFGAYDELVPIGTTDRIVAVAALR